MAYMDIYTTGKIFASILVIIVTILLWKMGPLLYRAWSSPLRRLPGPPSDSLLFGNMFAVQESSDSALEHGWLKAFGHVIMVPSLVQVPFCITSDTRALNHVLTHTNEYQKDKQTRKAIRKIIGDGVLGTEGDQHKRQRRAMNPAFGLAQIRELTEIFFSKALELRDAWAADIQKTGRATRIDVLSWMSRATLDIIGLAGFNYDFGSVGGTGSELEKAFSTIFQTDTIGFFDILQAVFPPLKVIRTKKMKRVEEAQAVMQRIGLQLVADKKAEILAEMSKSGEKDALKSSVRSRDLLTLLIKANMTIDNVNGQRLSDEEVLGQVPTFIIAGHETTSGATVWCLFALTQAPEIQRKLREELLAVDTDTPTMDELNALPYLDMVTKETLRFHAPVPMTHRTAQKDDLIPLDKPYTDRYGKVQTSIQMAKKDAILIPISILNRAPAIWGDDADEFKPERWENPPEAAHSIPGVWSDMLTFLGGPHSCIGYRFAVIEMKALLFTLVRAFDFDLAVPASDITKRSSMTQRPLVLSEKDKGNQMPLLVSMHERTEN